MTKLAASEDKNTAAPTNSSTVPQRPAGVRFASHVLKSESATSAATAKARCTDACGRTRYTRADKSRGQHGVGAADVKQRCPAAAAGAAAAAAEPVQAARTPRSAPVRGTACRWQRVLRACLAGGMCCEREDPRAHAGNSRGHCTVTGAF